MDLVSHGVIPSFGVNIPYAWIGGQVRMRRDRVWVVTAAAASRVAWSETAASRAARTHTDSAATSRTARASRAVAAGVLVH